MGRQKRVDPGTGFLQTTMPESVCRDLSDAKEKQNTDASLSIGSVDVDALTATAVRAPSADKREKLDSQVVVEGEPAQCIVAHVSNQELLAEEYRSGCR